MSVRDSLVDGAVLLASTIPRTLAAAVSIGLLYPALAAASTVVAPLPAPLPGFWAANAVALTILVRNERRGWWALLLSVAVVATAVSLAAGIAPGPAFLLTAASLAEITLAAVVIRRLYDRSFRFDSSLAAYVNVQLAAAILAPAVGATIGAVPLGTVVGLSYGAAWWGWWTAAAMGALVVLPVILSATPERLRRSFTGRGFAAFVGVGLLALGLIGLATTQAEHPFVIIGLTLAAVAMLLNPFATACVSTAGFVVATLAGLVGVEAPNDPWLPTFFNFFASISLVIPFGISLLIEQLKREKAAAEASEERFRTVMDGAAIGMGLVDTNGNWIAANRSLIAMLGVSEAELRTLGILDFTHPEDRMASAETALRLIRGEAGTLRAERRLTRKDGATVWALIATSVVRDKATGAALYLIVQLEDITLRKQAEAALAESESRWNFALESAGQGVWDVNLATGKSFHSAKWKAMLGYADDEIDDDDTLLWLDLVHPEDRDRVVALEKSFSDGQTEIFECEFRVRHKDGHYLWVLDRGRIVARDPAGRPLRKIGTYTDITEMRRQADAIRAAENRWSFALDSAGQGVWDFNVRTRTSYYSPMWKALLGYADDEIGIDDSGYWLTLVHPDDLPAVAEANRRHLCGESDRFECEFRMAHKDGHWVWILDRGRVIERDADGAPVRMIGTHTDISRQKEAEQEIRRLSHRLQLAAAAGQIGLWEVDVDARRMWWDEGMFRLFGVPFRAEGAEEAYRRAVDPQAQERIDDAVRRTIETGRPAAAEFSLTLPSGEERHMRMMADIVTYPGDARRFVAGVNWDVTDQNRLTAAVSEEKERLKVTLASIGDAVISTDTAGRITFINPIAEAETGWAEAEAIGRPVDEVFSVIDEATGEPAVNPVAECLGTLGRVSQPGGAVLVARDGRRRDIRETVTPVRAASGEVIGTVLVFQDITGTRQMQRQLAYSAAHDALTGLFNRASFERELAAACAETTDRPRHAVFFIDLDRFKSVNDTGGHAAGDALLPELGRLIKASVRAQDMTARLGGDEFGLLLRDCPLPQAEAIARKLVATIGDLAFEHDGRRFGVGASVGIDQIQARATPSDVLRNADQACYEAKALGGNRACVHGRRSAGRGAALAG